MQFFFPIVSCRVVSLPFVAVGGSHTSVLMRSLQQLCDLSGRGHVFDLHVGHVDLLGGGGGLTVALGHLYIVLKVLLRG